MTGLFSRSGFSYFVIRETLGGTLTLQQVVNKVGFRLKNVIYANEVRIPVSTDFMAVMSGMQKGEQGLSCSEG